MWNSSGHKNGYEALGDTPHQDQAVLAETHDGQKGKKVASVAKMDNPIWYIMKACFVYVLVVLDIFLNSSVNSDTYEGLVGGRMTNFWPFLFLVVQTSVQLFIFLTLFLLMCNTYLMQIGLPGVVLSDFKYLGLAQIVYLLLTIVLGIMRILRFNEMKTNPDFILWDMPGFTVVFTIQNLSACIYYHQVLYSTFRLADEKYYMKTEADWLLRGKSY